MAEKFESAPAPAERERKRSEIEKEISMQKWVLGKIRNAERDLADYLRVLEEAQQYGIELESGPRERMALKGHFIMDHPDDLDEYGSCKARHSSASDSGFFVSGREMPRDLWVPIDTNAPFFGFAITELEKQIAEKRAKLTQEQKSTENK